MNTAIKQLFSRTGFNCSNTVISKVWCTPK
jgi:hypothetical protein